MQFHLYRVPEAAGFIETQSRMVVTRDWGGGRNEFWFDGYGVSVSEDEE